MTNKKCPHGDVLCTSPDRCTKSEQCLGGDYDAIARGNITEEWRCSGCGIESPDQLRSCDCPTNVLFKSGNRHAWKLDAPRVQAVAEAIKLLESEGYAITRGHGIATCKSVPEKRIERLEIAMKAVVDELEEDFDISTSGGSNKAMRLANELNEAIYGPGGF